MNATMSELGRKICPGPPIGLAVGQPPISDNWRWETGQGAIPLAGVPSPEIMEFSKAKPVPPGGPDMVKVIVPLPPGHAVGNEVSG
jgi:hypothetical protein